MSNDTLLAAVHAAVNAPASSDASASQTKETSMADTQNGSAAAPAKVTTLAELRAAYPELCASLIGEAKAEGASAEHERLLGIEKLGAQMQGHAALIAELKADASVTPEKAALRLIEAENALRASQLQGVKDVEKLTGKVAAAPRPAAPRPAESEKASTPEGWKAEYAASAALRAEFASADDYVAYKANESKVRVLGRKSA